MVVESGDGRFHDVGGRAVARRHTPTPALEEQRGLGLSSGETELTGEGATEPRGRVLAEVFQSLCDLVLAEPGEGTGVS